MIELYVDGACSNNQDKENSIGGWAYILIYGDNKKIDKGQVKQTTNNRMKMKSLL